MSQAHTNLDPYTTKAESHHRTPQEKIDGLREIMNSVQTAMLTTRSSDGQLHSRAMNPASRPEENGLTLVFLANNVSHKFEEIQTDSHVNISFIDHASSNWASICGKARVSQNQDEIRRYWTSATTAWFGDLKDGVHKGNETDPRVSLIEVVPDEIRYWYVTKGKIGRALEVGVGAATGKTASPGELRTISKDEIQLVEGLHKN
ncbi:hypothetical protein FA15DRAFT_680304 [Coprinopsis marcescibilis]|uniref:General stress protein FMN-binding split barrel domain-containing protein n=1 Tax=Coprinopsis marcescibilis TaxID=230819 RepID=A0A5C3KY21_COPMA|nr:hypothetical protein FA15DRAFT_680304 [Coprinopsis marcescibilis]